MEQKYASKRLRDLMDNLNKECKLLWQNNKNIVELERTNKDFTGANLTLKESLQLSERKVRPYGMKYLGGEKTKPMLAANKYGDDKVAFGTNFKFDATKRFMPLVKISKEEESKNPLSQSITSLETQKIPATVSTVPIKEEDLTNRLLKVREKIFKKFFPELAAQLPKKKPEIFDNTQTLRSKKKAGKRVQKEGEKTTSDSKPSSTEVSSSITLKSREQKPKVIKSKETAPKGFVTQRYETLLAHHN